MSVEATRVDELMERLHAAREQLTEALNRRVNETGLLLRDGGRDPERLETACAVVEASGQRWLSTIAEADSQLGHPEGGE